MRKRVVCPTLTLCLLAALALTAPVGAQEGVLPGEGQGPGAQPAVPKKVIKTDREWAKLLTQSQFLVTRRKSTEPAFSGKYLRNHALGLYACVCCGQPLFSSRTKFESGTGWPSFWTPVNVSSIQTAPDYHGTEPRVEVTCSRCDAHLGHVFDDGPPPTGLRFCMNSAALKFIPEATAKAKTKAKPAPSSPTPDASQPTSPDAPPSPAPAP